ncbi:MAG: Uma2 family endonuclease [Cyanomargarita calcarea GSE-NOS-MK-12-04C]|jgi:Uma2 family endonuclease|uniref:Uma2 family endonuclease n=1 Tax=Cyanomargarita calcarea GSE-NOS-MK-12-04C TaxID=2839659 RepID=A0A951QIV8_9CYAN|nr:Uma2 family endonuclease [Cyanomargarita calcarea GSE-NOS-MK-12-04C]
MTQALQKLFTFDEFVDFLQEQPENICYELYDGDIIQMPLPTGEHEEIVGFLIKILLGECLRLNLNYFVPNKTLVKPLTKKSGYFPDIVLLNRSNLRNEPLWKKESVVTQPESIPLVIEVVSTNWRDDYLKKLADYDEMGIREYWIVDYGAFANKSLIGESKQPTITIYSFNDEGEYRGKQFRGNDRIESPTFTELNLTAEQIFAAQMN